MRTFLVKVESDNWCGCWEVYRITAETAEEAEEKIDTYEFKIDYDIDTEDEDESITIGVIGEVIDEKEVYYD